MKKLLTFFLTALLAFSVGWAETTTVEFEVGSSGNGVLSTISSTNNTVTSNGVTLAFNIGTNQNTWPTYYSNDGMVRFYTGNTLTITCGENKVISSVTFTYGSSYTNYQLSLSSDQPGSYNTNNYTWTGSSSSVQFTNTGSNTRFHRVVVNVNDDDGTGGGSSGGTCDATIAFKSGTGSSDASTAMTSNSVMGNVESGAGYISSFPTLTNVYLAKNGYGWKLGTSSKTGTFTVNLAARTEGWTVKKIIINAIRYSTSEGTIKVTTSSNTTGQTFPMTSNTTFTDYEFDVNADITSFTIATTSKRAYIKSVTLVCECETSEDPTLLATPTTLALTDIPYDGSSTSGTIHVAGAHLTNDVTVSVSGADFGVSPTTISTVDGTVDENITVTYSGSSTTEVTATVTISCGDLTQTVTVTAKKATPPAASITVNPSTLTINDSGTGNSLTITGENVSGNINASLATNDGWYLNPNTFGNTGGTATVTYNGRALSASNTVTATATGATDASATVNYIADLYIVTDNGVTGNWDFTTGTPMTYNNGVYTASFTANVANTFILFARKLGNGVDWNTRYVFGPDSSGDWWLPTSGNGNGNIDLNDDDPIKIQTAGTYIITIDATSSPVTFTITKEVVNEGDFVLVTDATDLVAGNEVIIVNSGSAGAAKAMSTTQNNNNRGDTDVTVTATKKVTATETTQIFTLESGNNGWYFKTVNGATSGYIYAASNSSNHLKTEAEPDVNGNAKAAISISGNVASIVFQGNNSHNVLQHNSSSSIFSCYGSASQGDVYLYQRTASTEPSITVNPTSLDLVIPVSESSVSGTVTVTETNTTGTTSVSINGDTNIFSATLENGTLTVTYNGNATMTSPDVATITLTNGDASATVNVTGYKRVEATGTLYSKVTNANQIQDGLQYIIVFENTTENNLNLGGPQALNGVNGGGTGTTVEWEEQGSIINISGTNAIEFTLNGNASSATLSYTSGSTTYYLEAGSAPSLDLQEDNPTEGYDWSIANNNNGYYLQWTNSNQVYTLRYNTGMSAAADRFRLYTGGTGQIAYLYVLGSAVATPVITPASGRYSEDQEVTITCATTGATIYYTVNGGETQTYDGPFTVDVDEDHTQATIVAWAVKDDLTSEQVTATYTYYHYNGHVSNIAEFLELNNGEEAIFDNPVVVLFDYSQARNSNYEPNGQEYIWIKDRTGYTQLFIQPAFDNTQGGFVPKYENGDVIPAGFKVKKNYFDNGQYYQGQCTDTHSTFQEANSKALADPEQVTLSELLANPANYNNRYLYINKLQVSNVDGLNFTISADENGDNVSEVQGGSAIVGYNKYNSPAWKNKNGEVVGVTLPTDNNYYNVKFIFQKWQGGYEIMPIEFTLWKETSLLLEDLVQVGVEGQPYTISNQLHAVAVTWDNNKGKFAIFAKDDEMYANKSYPTANQESYLIRYENGTFINEVEQKDYDQSNWIEILIPSEVTQKPSDAYQSTLDGLKEAYENKLLAAGKITGTYVDDLNPTIEMTTLPSAETASTYKPNIYCTVNFPMYNFENGGAQGNDGVYFMMDAKPHEFCKVVWAYYEGSGNYFVAPEREGDVVNGHDFKGSFLANMSLCEDVNVAGADVLPQYFRNSTEAGLLYGFNAIVRKNEAYWNPTNGAPRRIQPSDSGKEEIPAYIVYPLNVASNSTDNVVSVKEVLGNKAIESVHYYNMMGMEGKTPFEGINIVVTRYTDGSTSTIKVMK